MTQFRALPVRRGDAFLLQSARGDYLVDGGAPGCDLPALLDERKVKKLRAVISTGTSPERLGGVVDLLSAGRKPSEVWLPDSLRSLADAAFRFDGDYEGWIRLVAKGRGQGAARLFDEPLNDFSETGRAMAAAVNLLCLGFSFCTGEVPPQKKAAGNESGLLFELATQLAQRAAQRSGGCRPFAVGHPVWELLHVANATDLVTLCARMIEQEAMAIPARQRRYRKPLLDSLLLTAQVTLLCAESGARVRYFRHTGRREGGWYPGIPCAASTAWRSVRMNGGPGRWLQSKSCAGYATSRRWRARLFFNMETGNVGCCSAAIRGCIFSVRTVCFGWIVHRLSPLPGRETGRQHGRTGISRRAGMIAMSG